MQGQKLRVTLERVQLLESKEPFFDRTAEIRLRARVSTRDHGGLQVDTVAPESGCYRVSADPSRNVLELELPIFEGPAEEHLEVELTALELDTFSADEPFQTYRRVHLAGPEGLAGRFAPSDEGLDPEELSDWRVWYRIEVL